MYWYWKKKGIRPSVFYQIPYGELTIIRAFYELEVDVNYHFISEQKRHFFAHSFRKPSPLF
ncbi:hypothetical protein D9545_16020 [Geobacillus stearothermophilus]|nr:hypothetical protein D9545_16020 [Geobacillus stearothermophilus]